MNGMVALVSELHDAGLAVTLLNARALMRDGPVPMTSTAQTSTPVPEPTVRCDNGAQVTDGRYTTTYKMNHCNVIPTSPTAELSEFPPQRTEVSHGLDNFEVGGAGSGDTYNPVRTSCCRRDTARAECSSMYSQRPSRERDPDAFASSLRKYPSMSPERSSEMVERLITYTHSKNYPRSPSRSPPTRCYDNSSTHTVTLDRFRNSSPRSRAYEEVAKTRPAAPDDSPTRDKRKYECDCRKQFYKQNEVRVVKDITRRVKESIKNMSAVPCNQSYSIVHDERFDSHLFQQSIPEHSLTNINVENVEIQAAAAMVSREAATSPLPTPVRRTVGISLSATSSGTREQILREVPKTTKPYVQLPETTVSRSIQTLAQKSVQTTTSAIEIDKNSTAEAFLRKSKSDGEVSTDDNYNVDILEWLTDESEQNPELPKLKEAALKKLENDILSSCDYGGIKIKIGDCLKNSSLFCLRMKKDRKIRKEYIANEVLHEMRKCDCFNNRCSKSRDYREDASSLSKLSDKNNYEDVIKEWINDIPIKKRDFLLRPVRKYQIYNTFVNRLKHLIVNTRENNEQAFEDAKSEILDVLEEIPIEFYNSRNKRTHLNKLALNLVNKLKIFSREKTTKPSSTRTNKDDQLRPPVYSEYIHCTENEIKDIITNEILSLNEKNNLALDSDTLEEVTLEIIDILIDSMTRRIYDDNDNIIKQIAVLLQDSIKVSQNRALVFAKQMIASLKNVLKGTRNHTGLRCSQTVLVLQNSQVKKNNGSQRRNSRDTPDFSIKPVNEEDIRANLDLYVNQLTQQIDEWLTNLKIPQAHDNAIRQAVVHELADDIVERHKYLELNHNNQSTDYDELEHLKYQIFKWINKLVGEDNTETIDHAADLMQRIQSIPVPMLTKPEEKTFTKMCHDNVRTGEEPLNQISQLSTQNLTNLNNNVDNNRKENDEPTSSRKMWNINNRNVPSNLSYPQRRTSTSHSSQNILAPNTTSRRISLPSPDQNLRYNNYSQTNNFPQPITTNTAYAQDTLQDRQIPDNWQGNRQSMEGALDSYESNRIPPQEPAPQTSKTTNISNTLQPPCCSKTHSAPSSPTMKQLNDEYDEFLKQWVKEIPIPAHTADEAELADKARLGIYNGIWKAITKLKFDPDIFNNQFYYEDVLEQEIDELLDLLPQSPELDDKKVVLKAVLLQRTGDTNEQIRTIASPASYRQQLAQNIANSLPSRRNKVKSDPNEDPIKQYEEMLILCIADDFILSTRYNNEDKVKANAYRNKIIKRIEEFLDDLKRTHGKEIKELDKEVHINDVFSALHKVPIPSEDTIKEEADEILLGIEVEQWFTDLPLIKNDSQEEYIQRRRLRDALTKKIHEMVKDNTIGNGSNDAMFKQEISRFLDKLPLERDDSLNTNFMIDELANRIKNRIRTRPNGKRKSVAFENSNNYEECAKLCSLFTEENSGSSQFKMNMPQNQPYILSNDLNSAVNNDYQDFERGNPLSSSRNDFNLDSNSRQLQSEYESNTPALSSNAIESPGYFKQMPISNFQNNQQLTVDPSKLHRDPVRTGVIFDGCSDVTKSPQHICSGMSARNGIKSGSDQPTYGRSTESGPSMQQSNQDSSGYRNFSRGQPAHSSWQEPSGGWMTLYDSKHPLPEPRVEMKEASLQRSRFEPYVFGPQHHDTILGGGFRFANNQSPNQQHRTPQDYTNQFEPGHQSRPADYQQMQSPYRQQVQDQMYDRATMPPISYPRTSLQKESNAIETARNQSGYLQSPDHGIQGASGVNSLPPCCNKESPAQHFETNQSQGYPNYQSETPYGPGPNTFENTNISSCRSPHPINRYVNPQSGIQSTGVTQQSFQRDQMLTPKSRSSSPKSSLKNSIYPKQAPNTSAEIAPSFYRSTDRVGIQQTIVQNRSNSPQLQQHVQRMRQEFGQNKNFVPDTCCQIRQGIAINPLYHESAVQEIDHPQDKRGPPYNLFRNVTPSKYHEHCAEYSPRSEPHSSPTFTQSRNAIRSSPVMNRKAALSPNRPGSNLFISNEPVGYSTPNQVMNEEPPPFMKKTREPQRNERESARRRIDFETEEDEEEVSYRCHCMERVKRCKRRKPHCSCDGQDLDRYPCYLPIHCPFPRIF